MMKTNKNITNTGSDVAQEKKVRVSAVRSPVVSKNKLDFDTQHQNINLGIRLKIMSLNVEGISMHKCEYLGRLLKNHNIDILLQQETHLEKKSTLQDLRSLDIQKYISNATQNMESALTLETQN